MGSIYRGTGVLNKLWTAKWFQGQLSYAMFQPASHLASVSLLSGCIPQRS